MATAATNTVINNIELFISYNWDHQNTVRLIYNGLQSENISCWMDEKQMTGGTSLYRQLAGGVDTCKLVVACVSEEYCSSKNCTQEIRYAYDLKKAILPVLVGKVAWPLKGELGFIFAGRLYVDVSKSLQELEDWSGGKVNELLEAVRNHLSNPLLTYGFQTVPPRIDDVDGDGVKLLIFYRANEFTPLTCADVYPQERYKWSSFPHIKCSIRRLTAGLKQFEVVRDAMASIFTRDSEIGEIGQRCGNVSGKLVAEVTCYNNDEVEGDRVRRQFCTYEGRQHSWHEAGRPYDRKSVKLGNNVIICGGHRRTVLVIRK